MKHVAIAAMSALAAAACTTTSDTNKAPKPAWSSIYTVPFDSMVMCLAQPAGEGFVVNLQPRSQPGQASVLFVPRAAPQVEARYEVRNLPDGTIRVDWVRIGSVGGLDWLDTQARQRANRCGGIS